MSPPRLLAVDDTDGPDGGCTTYLASRILERIGPKHAAGRPRLVRLNPDNPYKTRGNAAIALPLDRRLDADDVLDPAMAVVEDHARVAKAKGAGLAVFDTPPDRTWYERGVREQIPINRARDALADTPTRTLGNGRGLVGCLCAAAWRPDETATYTRIAYRDPNRWGTPREIGEATVRQASERFDPLFDSWDPIDAHAAIAPRTPCPVLHGIRATRPDVLEDAANVIDAEPEHAETTFVTNQASDDHLDPDALTPVTIAEQPQALPGGHAKAKGHTPSGDERQLLAFEPTGRLRHALLDVEPGDTVLPAGSLDDDQVNLEKLLHVPQAEREPATCPGCGGAMASQGADRPRKCPRCGTRANPDRTRPTARWAEASVSARRHLARPLELGLAEPVARAAEPLLEEPPAASEA